MLKSMNLDIRTGVGCYMNLGLNVVSFDLSELHDTHVLI